MSSSRIPSVADLVFLVAAPIKAIHGGLKLTQSDGDLAAHIRMGDVILASKGLPPYSLASYTATLSPLVAHGWLSELLFALLYRAGGLALIAVVTGCVIAATHASVALFLRNRGVDARWALVAALISLSLSAGHWLARPHMFSILGSLAVILLLEYEGRRPWHFFALFAVWANLHGGWLFGLMLIIAYASGAAGEFALTRDRLWLSRARGDLTLFAVSSAATLVNPYGVGLHREVISAVTNPSLAAGISEYLAPNFQELINVPFMLGLLLCLALLALTPTRIKLPWLAVLLVTVFFALRSYRNIALFGVTAWPLVALHAAEGWPRLRKPFRFFGDVARLDPETRVGAWSVPVALVLLLIGLNRGEVGGIQVIDDKFDRHTFPVDAVTAARAAHLTGRVFHPWVWGGYLMEAWPGAPLHVDPLKFTQGTMDSYTTIAEVRPGWESELARWKVETVLLRPEYTLAKEISKNPDWNVWYRDSTAVLFRRRTR
jgi:hypothetical protein